MNFPLLRIGDLACDVPVIQGGMGIAISMSGLASAVANEGGIGVIATSMIGFNEPDIEKNSFPANIRVLRNEIRKAKEKTEGVLGVNIMVALTNFSDMVRTSIEEGIDLILAGAGLPLDLPSYLKDGAKTKLVPIISSARAATIICRKWMTNFNYLPDAFVVEGPLAGGHLGFKVEQLDDPDFALEKLIPEVIKAVKPYETKYNKSIPVIAAGGIFTGSDIRRFFGLGIAGVQMATRFVATDECDADDAFKQAYVKAEKEDIKIIKSPVGLPGRAITNKFIDGINMGKEKMNKCLFHCIKSCKRIKSPYCIGQALANAQKGNLAQGFAFAGQNAYRIKEIISVKELINRLREEYLNAD